MQHRPLGRTGVSVSKLCLGTMMFGYRCDEAESGRILDAAIERGAVLSDEEIDVAFDAASQAQAA